MERAFQIAAATLVCVAGYFFLSGNNDGVFVSIVAACVSYFLSYRWQVKGRLAERAAAADREGDLSDDQTADDDGEQSLEFGENGSS